MKCKVTLKGIYLSSENIKEALDLKRFIYGNSGVPKATFLWLNGSHSSTNEADAGLYIRKMTREEIISCGEEDGN